MGSARRSGSAKAVSAASQASRAVSRPRFSATDSSEWASTRSPSTIASSYGPKSRSRSSTNDERARRASERVTGHAKPAVDPGWSPNR